MMKKPKTIKLLKQIAVGAAIALLPCRAIAAGRATVVDVVDGNTVIVRGMESKLVCIDAPESNQAWGKEATARLRQLVPPGTEVRLLVLKGGVSIKIEGAAQTISHQMVAEGYAAIEPEFHEYDSCERLFEAQTRARQQNLNFWSQPNPCMPWNFRNNRCRDRESELW